MGDTRDRFRQCWDAYYIRLYNWAYRLYRNREEAEDAATEAFVLLWLKQPIDEDSEEAEYQWLCRTVLNKAKNHWRKKSAQTARQEDLGEGIKDPDTGRQPDKAFCRQACREALRQCIRVLSETLLPVVQLWLEEADLMETAARLSIPEGTVKSRRYAATVRLRRCLQSKGYAHG